MWPFFMSEKIRFRPNVRLLESKTGDKWEVCLIEFGESINGVEYGEEEVRENLHFFEDAKAFAYEFKDGLFDHLQDSVRERVPEGVSKNLVGWYQLPRIGNFKKADGTQGRGVLATFNVTANWLKEALVNSFEKGKRDLLGFSIDGVGRVVEKISESGRKIKKFLGFDKLDEVTVVTHPSAGGVVINLAESRKKQLLIKESEAMKEILKRLKESALGKYFEKISEDWEPDKIQEAIAEAQNQISKDMEKDDPPEEKPEDEPVPVSDDIKEALKKINADINELKGSLSDVKVKESRAYLKESLAKVGTLPDAVKNEILEEYGDSGLDKKQTDALLERKQATLKSLKESNLYVPDQDRETAVSVDKDEYDKITAGMTGMLLGEKVDDVRPMGGLHESYRVCNPEFSASREKIGRNLLREAAVSLSPLSEDDWDSQQDDSAHKALLKESRATSVAKLKEAQLTTSLWTEAFGDSIRRALMQKYERAELGDWRRIVRVTSIPDFRTNRRIRLGGFGNLSTVSEGGTYQLLDYPTDEEVTYAVTKRGNLTTLTMESMVNDDLGAAQRIINDLPVAAAQTLYEFVFDFIKDNVTLDYDSTALFHANHGNLGSTAFSATTLEAAEVAMFEQTEQDSGKPLGIRPRIPIIPVELQKEVWETITSGVSSDSGRDETVDNWFKSRGYENPIIPPYWTDANNWYLVADPSRYPTIEIGFLNGRQEPELFVQDQPTIGSNFTADVTTYKMRHIYGGDVLEHRGLYGAIVT